jgi:ribokinase
MERVGRILRLARRRAITLGRQSHLADIDVSARESIAVVGSINADVTVRVRVVPRRGETVVGTSAGVYPGGKGANQAVQAALLGASVCLLGRAGQDVLGDLVVASLAKAGVDVGRIVRDDGAGTGVASILVEETGENRIVVVPGANGLLSAVDIEADREAVEGAALVVAQLEVPQAAVERAFTIAAGHGIPTLLNPAPAQQLSPALLKRVDWIVPNMPEAEALAGFRVADVGSAVKAARTLRSRGPRCVIVTLGAEGAVVVSDEGEERVPAVPADEVVDTTAAGDAFCGALAAGLASGVSLLEAVLVANAAGAVAVGRPGAQPSLGDRAAIDRALNPSM